MLGGDPPWIVRLWLKDIVQTLRKDQSTVNNEKEKLQIWPFKMEGPVMLTHLQEISKEAATCTLISNTGERMEVKILAFSLFWIFLASGYLQVQAFLLAAVSPFLASLLSQVISIPALQFDLHPGRQLPLHLLALLLLLDVLPHHLPGLHWASLWGGGEATCHPSWHPDSNMDWWLKIQGGRLCSRYSSHLSFREGGRYLSWSKTPSWDQRWR